MNNRKTTEVEVLERSRIALENVEKQPKIALLMAETGYDKAMLAKDRAILANTVKVYKSNKTEKDEKKASYKYFLERKYNLQEIYAIHRKKAKMIFRKDTVSLDKLDIINIASEVYVNWVDSVSSFYETIEDSPEMQKKMLKINFKKNDLERASQLVLSLVDSRAIYIREKGESQNATKLKNIAFEELDDCMIDFNMIADIALDKHPQLLESLSKFIRS